MEQYSSLKFGGLFKGLLEHPLELGGDAGLAAALDLGELGDGGVDPGEHLLHWHAYFLEHGQDDALAIFEQGGHEVDRQHLRIAVFGGHALGGLHCFL